jgi:hypothetical protein
LFAGIATGRSSAYARTDAQLNVTTAAVGGRSQDRAAQCAPDIAAHRCRCCAAVRLECAALVTGDRTHFGALFGKTVHGVMIQSPRSLAEAVLARR